MCRIQPPADVIADRCSELLCVAARNCASLVMRVDEMSVRRVVPVLVAAVAPWCGCGSEDVGAGEVLVTSQVEIDPPGAGLRVGNTLQFSATPKTSSGIPIPNRTVVWHSSDPEVATISERGMVTAVSLGDAEITATVDDASGSVTVTVTRVPVAEVVVAPASATLLVGQSRQLTVTLRDEDGETLTGRTVTFISDRPERATVSSDGLVSAIVPGPVVVRARSEGKEGRSTITVAPRPATRLAFIQGPANGIEDRTIGTVRVAVQDAIGTVVTSVTPEITIQLSQNPGDATLSGTRTVRASGGIASFTDLRIDEAAEGYTLRTTAGSLSPAISAPFSIRPADPVALAIVVQPSSSAESGEELDQDPVIQLRDDRGQNVDRKGVKIRVSLIGSNGTLDGKRDVATDEDGRATFRDLRISGSGDFRLRFQSEGLQSVESRVIRVSEDDDDD